MSNSWRPGIACVLLGLAVAAMDTSGAFAERLHATTASIGEAIAARVIAVKCRGNMTPQEIAELDTYIEAQQTAFMSESKANQRLAETVFPRIARSYDHIFKSPEACTADARKTARDMLARVRTETASEKQAGLGR